MEVKISNAPVKKREIMGECMSNSELDELCINTIRFLSVDAIQKANSGHPGLPMGAAAMAYSLWTRFLKHNPKNPKWFDRDRFVLSGGHGSMLLYSLLHLTGYDLSLDEVKNFRQWDSKTPGHPERGLTAGVETTTGPLGQGFGNGVGMAIAEAHLATRFNRPGFEIVNHFTYGVVSDGDVMEGVAQEAASLAGHLKLGKLIYLYDSNHISLSASTNLMYTEDTGKRFEAYGWHVQTVAEGNDVNAVAAAIGAAQNEKDRPSLIIVRTHIGYGSPHKQDSFESHGSPLGPEEVKLAKEKLGWPVTPAFHLPERALEHFHKALETGKEEESTWKTKFAEYLKTYPDLAKEFDRVMNGKLPKDWTSALPQFSADPKGMATRVASGKIMNAIAPRLPELMGGSADLNPSTFTDLKGLGDFENPAKATGDIQGSVGGGWSYGGRNMHFGVREHGMGAIANGMAVHGGILPYGSTFLIFSDYMKPTIRLASLMELKVIYVFTHDSIALGEDGPTHQSIEQLVSLRSIPHMIVIRPCDANETVQAWKLAVEIERHPVALVLTRQAVPTLDRSQLASAEGLTRGAYILADPLKGKPNLILIATGSEVKLALAAQEKLAKKKIRARVVSMPSWELFEQQSAAYKKKVLPAEIKKRLSIEAGSTFGWSKYVGDGGASVGIDRFGASAPTEVNMQKLGFSVENVVKHALKLF